MYKEGTDPAVANLRLWINGPYKDFKKEDVGKAVLKESLKQIDVKMKDTTAAAGYIQDLIKKDDWSSVFTFATFQIFQNF